jgi:mRNA-degrading endonuclease toxin of MazEF toxin-antitoxin module
MAHHHQWEFQTVIVARPRRYTPAITVTYYCPACKGTRTVQAKFRIPSTTALTDQEVWEAKADRLQRQQSRIGTNWGEEIRDAMAANGVKLAIREVRREFFTHKGGNGASQGKGE